MLYARMLRAITSKYPLNSPRASILARLPSIPAKYGEFRGKRGIRYRGYWTDGDEVCQNLFWFGDFDPWVNVTLGRLARAGSVAIDIGANIGATGLTLAQAVGATGRVFCFEPMPLNIEYLRQNIAANAFAQIQVETSALSNYIGEICMTLPFDHAGTCCVAPDNNDPRNFRVQTTTFDHWLSEHPDLDISVCKIDVEGHESQVFAGMADTISKRKIPAFVFERYVGREVQSDPIFDLLTGHGYQLMRIEKGLKNIHYIKIGDPSQARPTNDFVAVLPGSDRMKRLVS